MPEKQETKKEKQSLVDAVDRALEDIRLAGEEIDFLAVAERTGVARSTLYRNRVAREHVATARDRQRVSANTHRQLLEEIESLRTRVEALEHKVQSLS